MEKCNFCAKTPETKLKCVCGGVVYCDKTCQRADWKRHKSDCPPFVVRQDMSKRLLFQHDKKSL